jgi:cysteine desulfurase
VARLEKIYLDYNASTPIAPEVQEAMRPFLNSYFGNPSALHFAGVPAKQAVEAAREQVANLIGAKKSEIIFTSGGTESNNHVLKGIFQRHQHIGKHIITTKIEHPAIINPCKYLETLGASVTYVDVDRFGRVNPRDIEEAITEETILISVMHANNEIGTIQPTSKIGEIARKHGVYFHTDAAQSIGKVPVNVEKMQADFLTIAGHKLYAPKGVGALYMREGVEIEPFMHGAGHEGGRRAGTENVLLVVGLGKACQVAAEKIGGNHRIEELRNYFWNELKQHFHDNLSLNGHPEQRLPNTLSVNFHHKTGQDILSAIPEIAASTGSACHAGQVTLSAVLNAMNVKEEIGCGAVRFSLGRDTTIEEINNTLFLLKKAVSY